MAVNPLDLQTVFSHINQVGKQQALSKESEVLRQDEASAKINKNSKKDAKDVPETKDLKEGPGKIKDEGKDNRRKKKEGDTKENVKSDNEEVDDDVVEENSLKDLNLGQNIDVMG